jgi:hypothetical protein
MKTPTQVIGTEKAMTLIRITGGLLLGAVLVPQSFAAGGEDGFQYNALFHPSQSQLAAEARGRVMIYDGLEGDDVERALDTQFNRIEHMMFVRTRETQPDGEVYVEDDGC